MILNYKITRSNRKTIALEVSPYGEVKVIAPLYATDREIDSIIKKKKFWLYKTINKTKEQQSNRLKKEYISGELFWYLGKRYRLDVCECDHRGLKFQYNTFILNKKDKNKAEKLFKEFYRNKAKEKLLPQVKKYAKPMGVQYNKVKLLEMKKRWGSCTSTGNIILNTHLIKAPLYVVDYVIVHELAHLIEFNHSVKFWNIIKTQLGDYSMYKEWLDRFDIEI